MPLGAPFFEDVPLVQFICLAFSRMLGGVNLRNSGLYRCVPCLSSAIISLWLVLIGHYTGAVHTLAVVLSHVCQAKFLWPLSSLQAT